MTKAEARRALGSQYRMAQVLGINQSTISRWPRMVPPQYRPAIQAVIDSGKPFVDKRRKK